MSCQTSWQCMATFNVLVYRNLALRWVVPIDYRLDNKHHLIIIMQIWDRNKKQRGRVSLRGMRGAFVLIPLCFMLINSCLPVPIIPPWPNSPQEASNETYCLHYILLHMKNYLWLGQGQTFKTFGYSFVS